MPPKKKQITKPWTKQHVDKFTMLYNWYIINTMSKLGRALIWFPFSILEQPYITNYNSIRLISDRPAFREDVFRR